MKIANFYSFTEFEKFYKNEEDDIKLSFYASILLKNWPHKNFADQEVLYILVNVMDVIKKYYEKYFENGFQIKPFEVKDKYVICKLLDVLEHLLVEQESHSRLRYVKELLSFSLSFDKDIILRAQKVICKIGKEIRYTQDSMKQIEVCLKLANQIVNLNHLSPWVQNNTYKPIKNFKMKSSVFKTLMEYQKDFDISDVYISILEKLYPENEKIMNIMKRNSVMFLLQNFESQISVDKRPFIDDLKDISRDRSFVINFYENLDESKESTEDLDLFDNFICFLEETQKFSETMKDLSPTYINKHLLNYSLDINLEFINNFERYLLFRLKYDETPTPLLEILEVEKKDGFIYRLIEDALINSKVENLAFIPLMKFFLEKYDVLKFDHSKIFDIIPRAVQNENSVVIQMFFQTYLNFVNKEEFGEEIVKRGCVDLFLNEITRNRANYTGKNVILLNILFSLYQSEAEGLKPFDESSFYDLCVQMVEDDKSLDMMISIIEYLTSFIQENPSSIEKITRYDLIKIISNIKHVDDELLVSFIELIGALSLNRNYKKKILDANVFTVILNQMCRNLTVEAFKTDFIDDSLSELLNKHTQFFEEYKSFLIPQYADIKEE